MRYIRNDSSLHLSAEEFKQKVPPVALMALLGTLADKRGVTIEGFPLVGGKHLSELREKHPVRAYVVTYAPIFILEQRRQWGRKDKSLPRIDGYYKALLKYIELPKTTYYNSFENTHHKWSEAEFWADWKRINRQPTEADEKAFLEEVRKEEGDHYAPIVLPHHTYAGGVKTTNPQSTWDKIKELGVDVKGKRVVDIGCYEGYTLHLALQDGAVNALGLDGHEGHLRNGMKIAWLKQSPVNFLHFNIHFNHIIFANDVILCLNMLHYTSTHVSLPRIFRPARSEVVFEVIDDQVPAVKKYAKEYNFNLVGEREGRRKRTILWFRRRTK